MPSGTIGERIKRFRLAKDMTQEELGEILGITKGAVQKYESGQISNFKADTIKKLSETFGSPPVYFMYDRVPEINGPVNEVLKSHFGEWMMTFLKNMDELNESGLNKVYEYCLDLAQIDKYRK